MLFLFKLLLKQLKFKKKYGRISFCLPIFCFFCDQCLAKCDKFRVRLNKLIFPQLLKIFSEFCAETEVSLPRSTIVPVICQINSDCAFTNDIRSILILFFHLCLGLISGLFPPIIFLNQNPVFVSRLTLRPTRPIHTIFLDFITRVL